MERKARENLSAAETLVGSSDPCPNAATSRAYYAAYQALWWKLEERGEEATDRRGVVYFRHDEVARLAQQVGLFDKHLAVLFDELREARTKADYYAADDCTQEEAQENVGSAQELIGALIGSEATQ